MAPGLQTLRDTPRTQGLSVGGSDPGTATPRAERERVAVALLTITLLVLYFALAFGARTVRQLHSTRSTGFKGTSGRPGSAEWFGGVLFVVALILGLARFHRW